VRIAFFGSNLFSTRCSGAGGGIGVIRAGHACTHPIAALRNIPGQYRGVAVVETAAAVA